MSSRKKPPETVDTDSVSRKIVGAEEAPHLYSDSVEVNSSLFDFRLHVRITLGRSKEEITYKHLCSLHLSPPHFKKLVQLLNEHLENYEQLFGEIPTQPLHDSEENDSKQH